MFWGKPGRSRKFHIFQRTEIDRSLCLKWMYFGDQQQPVAETQPIEPGDDDCAECVKRLNAHRGKRVGGS